MGVSVDDSSKRRLITAAESGILDVYSTENVCDMEAYFFQLMLYIIMMQ